MVQTSEPEKHPQIIANSFQEILEDLDKYHCVTTTKSLSQTTVTSSYFPAQEYDTPGLHVLA